MLEYRALQGVGIRLESTLEMQQAAADTRDSSLVGLIHVI